MRVRVLLVAVVVTVLAAACGGEERRVVEPVDRPDVPALLRFRGPTLDGSTLELADLAGRPVVFWFWASSCTDCSREAPTVEVLHKLTEGDAEVVGVTCGSPEAASAFEHEHDLTFPTLLDQDGTLTNAFGIPCQPSWAFLSPDGTVQVVGRVLDIDEVSQYLEAAGGQPLL